MKSVGKQLEAARQGRNWTPEAASKITKIRIEQLLDLERDDFTRFPSPAYARGFVRLYAKALGLDDRRMLAQLDGRLEGEDDGGYIIAPTVEYVPQRTEITVPIRINRFGINIILVLAGLFIGVFAIITILAHKAGVSISKTEAVSESKPKKSSDEDSTPAAKSTSIATISKPKVALPEKDDTPVAPAAKAADLAKADAPPPAPPVAPAPTPTQAKHQLMLHANRDCWVRISVIDSDGEKTLFQGIIEAGKTAGQVGDDGKIRPFEATQFSVKIADPSLVDVIQDGDNIGPHSVNTSPETFTIPLPVAQ